MPKQLANIVIWYLCTYMTRVPKITMGHCEFEHYDCIVDTPYMRTLWTLFAVQQIHARPIINVKCMCKDMFRVNIIQINVRNALSFLIVLYLNCRIINFRCNFSPTWYGLGHGMGEYMVWARRWYGRGHGMSKRMVWARRWYGRGFYCFSLK